MALTTSEIRQLLLRLDGEPADAIESETLDCKQWDHAGGNERRLREIVVCLANQRGGIVVLGVAERKRTRAEALVGVPTSVQPDDLRRVVYDGTQPPVLVEVEELIEPEGRLLVVRVPRGMPPHTTSEGLGKIRVGKECKPLTGPQLAALFQRPDSPDPTLPARKRVFSTAVGILRVTAGEFFNTSDGATSSLPGVLWYKARPDWQRLAERVGEFDRQRGRFRPHVEPAVFDGSDDTLVSAATEILRLYVGASRTHPDFEAIRAKFQLPSGAKVGDVLRSATSSTQADRPRLVLEYSDDGKPNKPGQQRFHLENRGKVDALNVVLAPIDLPRRVLTPETIRIVKSNGPPVEVFADVEFTDRPGPVHEYRKPLGDSLSAAMRTLDVVGPDRARFNDEGQVEWTVAASFVDPDGNSFEQRFQLRFNWAIAKFEAVETLLP